MSDSPAPAVPVTAENTVVTGQAPTADNTPPKTPKKPHAQVKAQLEGLMLLGTDSVEAGIAKIGSTEAHNALRALAIANPTDESLRALFTKLYPHSSLDAAGPRQARVPGELSISKKGMALLAFSAKSVGAAAGDRLHKQTITLADGTKAVLVTRNETTAHSVDLNDGSGGKGVLLVSSPAAAPAASAAPASTGA